MPQTEWLKLQVFVFSQFWRLKVPDLELAGSVPGEDSLSDLEMAAFLIWCSHGGEKDEFFGVSSYKDTDFTGPGSHPYDLI